MYIGNPLIQSPWAKKNLAVLMGDRINKGFLQEKLMYGCFARWPKNWPYCQGGHKAGFPCSCLNYFKPFFVL